jgi:hypothetical protein
MWVWTAIAWAGEVTVDEARALGPPDSHTALGDCACVALGWTGDGASRTLHVPQDQLREVRHRVASDGRHDVELVLTDGTVFGLEQAPCAVATPIAEGYAAVFAIPIVGDAVGVACDDALAPLRAYLTPHVVFLENPDYGPMASLHAERGDLPPTWSNERAILARCFTRGPAPIGGAVSLAGRVAKDGTVDHLRVTTTGPTPEIDACVLDRLSSAGPGAPRRGKLAVTVSWTPPAPAISP